MAGEIDKLAEWVSSYEILNNLVPGVAYVALTDKLGLLSLWTHSVWTDLVICYLVGLAIGRIGSLVVEPHLKRLLEVHYAPYDDFIFAERQDSKVTNLSSINNMYRSLVSMSLCLLVTVVVRPLLPSLDQGVVRVGACLVAAVLFAFSYRKQARMVADRVSAISRRQADEAGGSDCS